jgi:DNA-directed RNA polymerase subunit RPC12/RpoP
MRAVSIFGQPLPNGAKPHYCSEPHHRPRHEAVTAVTIGLRTLYLCAACTQKAWRDLRHAWLTTEAKRNATRGVWCPDCYAMPGMLHERGCPLA